MSYNLGIQHELPKATILEVNFVGTLGRHFTFIPNLNQLPVGTRLNAPNSSINVNALRPYMGYANVFLRDNSDNSNYSSLQVGLSRRLMSGFSFGVNYTYSKAIDSFGGNTPQDSYNPKLDIGLSSIHREQVLNFNYIYSLPFFTKSTNTAARLVLGGWEVSGVTSFQSGAPFTVTAPVDAARIGASSSRASVIGNPVIPRGSRTPERWFDGKAFLNPSLMPAGRFGDGGRNNLLGPGFQNWDISLLKSFPIREQARLQFRFETFNTFNHPNFTAINTTARFDAAGNPTGGFGAVNASGPGRILSLGLKLLF